MVALRPYLPSHSRDGCLPHPHRSEVIRGSGESEAVRGSSGVSGGSSGGGGVDEVPQRVEVK